MTDNFSTDKISTDRSQEPLSNSQAVSNHDSAPSATKPKKENAFVNILMNIVVPTLILTKLSSEQYLGATWGLVIALAFPIGYGIRYFYTTRKFNFFSALGMVSVLLTGGISLLHLSTEYYAIKEAAIPGLIGLFVIVSIKTRYPLVKTFIYNDSILKIEKITVALREHNNTEKFEHTLRLGSYFIAGSFFLSSALNYLLAKMLVVSPTGTPEFNVEVGKMNAISFPVIAVPSMIIMVATLFYIFRQIRLMTNLTMEDVMNDGNDNETNSN
jgi:hypothetical protein